jgi:glutaminase
MKRSVSEAHQRLKSNTEAANSNLHSALAGLPGDLFNVCLVGTSGNVHAVGDTEHEFSITSVFKSFVVALMCQAYRALLRMFSLSC